ncbi:ABC transporter permease subunit [Schnuerera sp. xch1]|uniref:ABC transporter permease n=1 Tax=Schnuerera sp. xch1 TaxID=2874283 RepID=UPI001CBD7D22|nr:ABC transporter permease subunit [Schnuerera sp. xch1]MBZ2175281.1 ABC transporter permease subunit [Schnuerera sp. xch1]
MKDYILKDKKLSILSKLIIIGMWILLSKIIDNEVIFPTIKSTFISLIDIVKNSDFLNIIISSLLRSLIGFLISLFLAIITGILSSVSKIIYNLMMPILNFLSSVPTMAIIILALIWLDSEYAPMFIGFIMVFPILYETVLKGILSVNSKIITMAQLYNVGKITVIKDIYIPSILLNLSLVFTSSLGINLKMVIAGEALSQPRFAIGSSLQLQKMYLNTSGVFAWIIIILLISKIFKFIVELIKRNLKINRWK